jgi:hypothetical protein
MSDDFYIGWQSQAPNGIGRYVRRAVVLLGVAVVAIALVTAFSQQTIGVAVFEWGTEKSFTGTLRLAPYPHLLVARPGAEVASAYYLVAPFKFGMNTNKLAALDGKAVTLKGTLIYRESQTMVEVKPESIKEATYTGVGTAGTSRPTAHSLGRQTLTGEIVDSKCYLGVMNPGQLAPHRACAVRCISGGIPPVLLVRQRNGAPLYFLLVREDGSPVNKQVLDMVAVPLTITGEVVRQGELLILRGNPATFKPVSQD